MYFFFDLIFFFISYYFIYVGIENTFCLLSLSFFMHFAFLYFLQCYFLWIYGFFYEYGIYILIIYCNIIKKPEFFYSLPGKNFTPIQAQMGIMKWWYKCKKLICLFFFLNTKKIVSRSSIIFAAKYHHTAAAIYNSELKIHSDLDIDNILHNYFYYTICF